MDGVFPPNLPIAEVTSVKMLKEGDYFYELEAKPVAGHLNELSLLFVIAPSEYDDQELFP
jgi:cell shape-determining protein MreC